MNPDLVLGLWIGVGVGVSYFVGLTAGRRIEGNRQANLYAAHLRSIVEDVKAEYPHLATGSESEDEQQRAA